ncbi:TonB-dependent receptor [Bacteroides caecimuris]|uniref:SusC/RagA family TonB-linked outer membrane protein n=1 Tax=Bacteroides caecimuris TaxID=1796613 RepID=UPI00265D1841|nr:TonB-dependent receptor [Bacteroides caecimuris]
MTKHLGLAVMLFFSFGLCVGNYAFAGKRTSGTFAEQKTGNCTGVVKDVTGETIVGASVLVKGTTSGVSTDLDGNFTIPGIQEGSILVISFIGYRTQEVKWNGEPLVITLEEDSELLEEVVVAGYTSTRKRDLIASVSTVKADQISNMPVTNITQGLAGRAPGLIVQASGGGINSRPTISIRGGGDPIYVIDGVIRSSDDFANLSPDDIESMSILKDASATAVYGSRATNGIIQVQTKRGKAGRALVEYDFNMSFSQPSIWPKKMSSYDRAIYANIARENDGLEPIYNQEGLNHFKNGTDPLNFNNTNWRSLVLNDWAPQQKHTIRLSGGNANNRYYASLGYIDQNSLYKNHNHWMKRTNFRIAQNSNIDAIGLQVNTSIDGYRQHQTHPYTSTASSYYQVFSHINDKYPNIPGVNKYGLPYNITDNPVAETAKDAGYNRTISNVINGRGELIWTLPWVEELNVRVASNYRYYSNSTKQWRKDAAQYDWESTTPQYANKPLLRYQSSNGYAFTNQAFLEYAKDFGKHHISVLGGFEQYYEKNEGYWLQRDNFQFDIDQIIIGDANGQTNGGALSEADAYGNTTPAAETELGRAAWIGQVKYNYDSKYYAEASIRHDGSDRFAKGKRWGTFFSGSLGWVVTAEEFMQNLVDKNILNNFKIRASYGETGLDGAAGRYSYMTNYNYSDKAFVLNGQYQPGFSEGILASPDLTWYTTKQFDLGFDFASLNNRLYGSFDYFYYQTTGYLTNPTSESYLNQVIGVSMPKIKSDSEHRRAGVEIQLGWRDNIGDFKYDISANFTYFDELWALDESEAQASVLNPYKRTQQQKGYYGTLYKNLGYYTSAEDVYNSAGFINSYNSGYLTAGDIKYLDANGDGKLDSEDQRRLGNSGKPRGQFGLNINLEYKGFYFSTLFQGSTSFDMYLSPAVGMQTGQAGVMPVAYSHQKDFWRPDNTDAKYPRLMSNTALNNNNNYESSDFWLINGAYLRMKDFQFGYDLKRTLLKNLSWLSKCKIGISGQNIFTISKATKYGLDPENSDTGGYGYPIERTLAFTLNLGF